MLDDDWATRNNVGRAAWASISHDHRQRLVLEVIGDRTLALTEIDDEITERIPRLRAYLRNRNVDAVLRKMQALGEIQRNDAPPGKPHTYRRPPLQGPILDLERAFHDGGDGLGTAGALPEIWDAGGGSPYDEEAATYRAWSITAEATERALAVIPTNHSRHGRFAEMATRCATAQRAARRPATNGEA